MKSVREQFEEIWPVPEGVMWSPNIGQYVLSGKGNAILLDKCYELDLRLDTFTRCQETTDVYVSLIEEMAMEIEGLSIAAYGCVINQSQGIIDRAQNVMEQKK